jgi:PPOX class probable F420-dependent enzyme
MDGRGCEVYLAWRAKGGDIMGVKLTDEELDAFLTSAHTLTIATIRKSGEPFMTPVWYVWMDGAFWVRTGGGSAKVKHIRRDARVCCMVEDGEAWVDLRAVVANCDAEFATDEAQIGRFLDLLDKKYADFRMQRSTLPDATRNHYASERVILRMKPREGELRSWYNRKIRMSAPA